MIAACSSSTPAKKSASKKTTTAQSQSSTTTLPGTTTTAPAPGSTTTVAHATSTTSASSKNSSSVTQPSTNPCQYTTPGAALSSSCDTQTPALQLQGAGANSINPFFEQAFYYYNKANSNVSVNFNPSGSSVGVTDIEQNTVQFADSEIPIAVPASGTGGTILQLPVDLGGVAISYNVPGLAGGLQMNGATLSGIFLGTITNWNQVPGVSTNLAIVPVHRADSSGPGYDLDQYLIDTSPTWSSAVGGKAIDELA